MKILSLIGKLIDYPTQELVDATEEVMEFIARDEDLCAADKHELIHFLDERLKMDLLDWQSDYDALFERGRSLSLLLFEHVHGESRDRGQAMIDLMQQYKLAGLDIDQKELPDYIPLYLEFLSTQGKENAQGWLQDVAHILAVLKVRLAQRDCDYEVLFNTLVNLSGVDIEFDGLVEQVKKEKRDDTKEAIDKVWEEEMVKFGPDASQEGCATGSNKPGEAQRRDQEVPISFFKDAAASENTVAGGQ